MPTRYLKPGICDSKVIQNLGPLAEVLYYRLLVNVDDFGRLDAREAVVRAKCFPLKDGISLGFIKTLLKELHQAKAILLYISDDCEYLQMLKWDNIPRAKESKCPAPVLPLHTDVLPSHTNLPVTVTVTETVNRKPELKPEQKTGTVPPRKKRSDPKQDDSVLQTACRAVWEKYCNAYFDRYGTEPVRNAKVNGQVKLFVGRLGFDDSPGVAGHYVSSNLAYYVTRGHSVDCMLADAEKLRTEWATGRSMTGTRARQIDQSQANFNAVGEAMKILEGEKHAEAS